MNKYIWLLFGIFYTALGVGQCLEGDCVNGFGKFACDCGYVYEGNFVNGSRTTGILTKSDLVYEGEFSNDLAHGLGVIRYIDGSWYEGTFVENYPDGYGGYHFSNGSKYLGEIQQGNFSGLGIEWWVGKDSSEIDTRIGHFEEDQLNGLGCSLGFDGEIHFGKYVKGAYVGFGFLINLNLEVVKAGNFKKKKHLENEIKFDYPEKGKVGLNGFSTGSFSYDLISDMDGGFMHLVESKKGIPYQVMIYDKRNQLFYLSSEGTPKYGYAIKFTGEIYFANLETEYSNKIILGELRYAKNEY